MRLDELKAEYETKVLQQSELIERYVADLNECRFQLQKLTHIHEKRKSEMAEDLIINGYKNQPELHAEIEYLKQRLRESEEEA